MSEFSKKGSREFNSRQREIIKDRIYKAANWGEFSRLCYELMQASANYKGSIATKFNVTPHEARLLKNGGDISSESLNKIITGLHLSSETLPDFVQARLTGNLLEKEGAAAETARIEKEALEFTLKLFSSDSDEKGPKR